MNYNTYGLAMAVAATMLSCSQVSSKKVFSQSSNTVRHSPDFVQVPQFFRFLNHYNLDIEFDEHLSEIERQRRQEADF